MGQHASSIRYSQDVDAMQMETYGQAKPLKRAPYIETQRVYEHHQQEDDFPPQSPYSRWTRRFSILRRRVIQRGQERRELPYPTFKRTKTGEEKEREEARNLYLHTFFQEFDPVFIVDDSASMLGDRWREVENALAGITPLCAAHNPEGVDIYFVNHWAKQQGTGSGSGSGSGAEDEDEGDLGGYTNLTTAPQTHSVFNTLHPSGRTPFGARLSHLLLPYLRLVENMTFAKADADADAITTADGGNNPVRWVKPLYIVGITDGAFTDDAEEILLQAARRLEGCRAAPGQVKVRFFHVGEDEGARSFLEALEGAVRRREGQEGITRDVLAGDGDFTTGKRLTADGMVRRMTRAVTA